MTHSSQEYRASDKGSDHKAARQSKTARATTYRILIRDTIACLDYERTTRGHGQAVRLARSANSGGLHVTVLNGDNGNVVLFLGTDLSVPSANYQPS